MAFIRTIPPSEAQGPVREMYEQARARFGYVPNWAQAFSLRPEVRDGWTALLKSIQSNLPVRSYELATLAAARALRNSYCALAHGSVLVDKVFDAATVTAIVKGVRESPLEPRELAMMAFVEKWSSTRTASPLQTSRCSSHTATATRRSSIWPRQRLPAASSASSLTPWEYRQTRTSTTSIRLCGRR